MIRLNAEWKTRGFYGVSTSMGVLTEVCSKPLLKTVE